MRGTKGRKVAVRCQACGAISSQGTRVTTTVDLGLAGMHTLTSVLLPLGWASVYGAGGRRIPICPNCLAAQSLDAPEGPAP